MRKAVKHITSLSMWLAVLAMLAHMVIPHDHHISETFSDQKQNCPASHHQNGEKPEFPVHCHAFNDLASEKPRSFHISQNITEGFVAPAILPDNLAVEPQVSPASFFDFQTPVSGSYFHRKYLSRAPPSLA